MLIQAFSRINRISNPKKQYGNIISFRNLKKETDEAIARFSEGKDKKIVLIKSYKEYIDEFNKN